MWSRREILAASIIAVTVIGLFVSTLIEKSSPAGAKTTNTLRDDFELRSFTLEGKLLLSISGREAPNPLLASSTTDLLTKKPTQPLSEKGQLALTARQFVLARYLGKDSIAEERRRELASQNPQVANEIGAFADGSSSIETLTEEADSALGWTTILVTEEPDAVRARLQKTIWGLAGLAFGVLAVGVAGLSLWIYLIVMSARKRLKANFSPQGFHPALRLEIFAMCLLVVTGAGYLLREIPLWIDWSSDPLTFNVVMMGALPLLAILWPMMNGVSFRETLSTLGLAPRGTWHTFKDVLIAPFAYSAMWFVLLPVLMVYALTIQWLGIDMASGAHPIFVWMSKPGSGSKGPSLILLFILASVVAPVLEEIMFRGAFYSWLRLRLGVVASLISSGLLFAAIHPQGVLGLLPLTACAITFGMLREWRGTLFSAMIVHALVNGVSLGVFFIFMSAT